MDSKCGISTVKKKVGGNINLTRKSAARSGGSQKPNGSVWFNPARKKLGFLFVLLVMNYIITCMKQHARHLEESLK